MYIFCSYVDIQQIYTDVAECVYIPYIYIGSVCEVCYIDIYAHKSTYMCIHAYVFVCLCVSVYYLGQSRHSPSKLFLLYY